jgi:hypothetical protein
MPWIYFPKEQSLENAEKGSGKLTRPDGPGPVVVLSPHCRAALGPLRPVVVHGHLGVVYKDSEALPFEGPLQGEKAVSAYVD